jgi:hypothetical protein
VRDDDQDEEVSVFFSLPFGITRTIPVIMFESIATSLSLFALRLDADLRLTKVARPRSSATPTFPMPPRST